MSGHPGDKSADFTPVVDSAILVNKSTNISSKTENNDRFGIKTLYPNPAQTNTTVKYSLENSGNVRISIVNSFGVVVELHEINHPFSGIFYKTLQISQLQQGVYFVKISSSEKEDTFKLIIQ